MSDITHILDHVQQGDPEAADELRKLAAAKRVQQSPSQTLQATALVHEACLCLTGEVRDQWQDRAHFFRAAAEAMRRISITNTSRLDELAVWTRLVDNGIG